MATWVRSGTGTTPSATDANLTGNVALDNATAPSDFDPDAVNSVRFQWRFTVAGLSNDTWTDHRSCLLYTGGVPAFIDLGNATRSANGNYDQDQTDSSVSTGFSVAQWEAATFRPNSTDGSIWATWNKVKGADGTTGTIPVASVTVTIDYTPSAPAITPGLASQLVTTFAPTVGLYTLEHFRWSSDTTLTSPNWLAAEDAPLPLSGSTTIYLLYFLMSVDGFAGNKLHKLQFRKNGGAWTDLSGASNPDPEDSANVTHGATWSVANQQLTDSGFTDQDGKQWDTSFSSAFQIGTDSEQEHVVAVRFTTPAAGDSFEFRLNATGLLADFPALAAQRAFEITPGLAQSLVTAFDPSVWRPVSLHYRWADDGTLTSPTWKAAEDTELTVPTGTNNYLLYHRFGQYGDPPTRNHELWYKKNGGAATQVTASSTDIRFYDSTNVTNFTTWVTGNWQLTDTGGLLNSEGYQWDTSFSFNANYAEGYETEMVFSLEFVSVAASDTFELFIRSESSTQAGDFFYYDDATIDATSPPIITPGLASSLTVAFDPTVAESGDYIFPDLATELVNAFDPTIVWEEFITPPLAQELVNAFDPTLVREALLKLIAFELSGTYNLSASATITPGLAQQLVTTFAPLVAADQAVTPGLAQSLAQAFNPTIAAGSVSITPGLATSITQAFDPTIAVGAATITPDLAQQLATTFDPTITTGAVTVTPALATQLVTSFDPTLVLAQAITPDLAQSLAQAFDPSLVADQAITPDLAQSLVAGFDPTLAYTYSVTPGLATSLATAFDPTVVPGPISLTPDLAQSLTVGFDPSIVLDTQYLLPGLASSLVTPFGPLVSIFGGDQFIAPALAEQLVTGLDPTVAAGSVSMTPGLASSLAQAFDPSLAVGAATITPGLAQSLATAFDPTLTTTYGITPGLATNLTVAFDPSVDVGSVTLTPGLATSLAQAFDPAVALDADYLFPGLAQQLVVAFDPAGFAQTQNIEPGLAQQLVTTFDPFVDLGTKYALPGVATSLLVPFSPVVMYWMPTLSGSTSKAGVRGTTAVTTTVGKVTAGQLRGVTSTSSGPAYTDDET